MYMKLLNDIKSNFWEAKSDQHLEISSQHGVKVAAEWILLPQERWITMDADGTYVATWKKGRLRWAAPAMTTGTLW